METINSAAAHGKMKKLQEQRDSFKTLPTQVMDDCSSDEDWMGRNESDAGQNKPINNRKKPSSVAPQKKSPPGSVSFLVNQLRVVEVEQQNAAARRIQRFFRHCSKNILCWHKEEIYYWQEQKLEVERRKQQELQDVAWFKKLGKQRMEVELQMEYNQDTMVDTGLDWFAYHQWSQEQIKSIEKHRAKGKDISESIRLLTGSNLHLRRDLSTLWNQILCAQEKTEVLKEEEMKWRDVITGLELATQKMEEVIELEPTVMDALAMRLQKAKEVEAKSRMLSQDKSVVTKASKVATSTAPLKAAPLISNKGNEGSLKGSNHSSKLDPPAWNSGHGRRKERPELDTSLHTDNSDPQLTYSSDPLMTYNSDPSLNTLERAENPDYDLYGYEIELDRANDLERDNDSLTTPPGATPGGARRRRSRSRAKKSRPMSTMRRKSLSKPKKKDQGEGAAAAAAAQLESSPYVRREQERGRSRVSVPSSLNTRDIDSGETKKPYSAYWQPQIQQMNASISTMISSVMSSVALDPPIPNVSQHSVPYFSWTRGGGESFDDSETKEDPPATEGNNNHSATQTKRRSTLSRHLEQDLKEANLLRASEDREAVSLGGAVRRKSKSKSQKRAMSISRRKRTSTTSKPRKGEATTQQQTAPYPAQEQGRVQQRSSAPPSSTTRPSSDDKGKSIAPRPSPSTQAQKKLVNSSILGINMELPTMSSVLGSSATKDPSGGTLSKKLGNSSILNINMELPTLPTLPTVSSMLGSTTAKDPSGSTLRRHSDQERKSGGILQETQKVRPAEDNKRSDTATGRRNTMPKNLQKELQEANLRAADDQESGAGGAVRRKSRSKSQKRAMTISRRRRTSTSKPKKKDQGEATVQQRSEPQEQGRVVPRSSAPASTARTSDDKSKNTAPRPSPSTQAQKKLVNSSILGINLDPRNYLQNSAPQASGHTDHQNLDRISSKETRRRSTQPRVAPHQEAKETNEKKKQEARHSLLPANYMDASGGNEDRRSILGRLKELEKEVKEAVASPDEEDTAGAQARRRRSKSRGKKRSMSISRRRRSSAAAATKKNLLQELQQVQQTVLKNW